MTIETQRLVLRPPREGDQDAVRAQLSRFEIAKWLAKVPHPYPPGHEQLWWARAREREALGHPAFFMMVLKGDETDTSIGSIAIGPTAEGPWRLGYWLDQPHWGKGLMSEAVAGVVAHALKTWAPDVILSGVYKDNAASAAILEKLGFVYKDTSEEWCEARQQTLPHLNLVLKP